MIGAGFGRLHHADAVRRIDEVLALNPDARVIALCFGSNDWDRVGFRDDLREVVRKVRAVGRIPVVPQIPFRADSQVDYPASLNAVVDEVMARLEVLPGPDLRVVTVPPGASRRRAAPRQRGRRRDDPAVGGGRGTPLPVTVPAGRPPARAPRTTRFMGEVLARLDHIFDGSRREVRIVHVPRRCWGGRVSAPRAVEGHAAAAARFAADVDGPTITTRRSDSCA